MLLLPRNRPFHQIIHHHGYQTTMIERLWWRRRMVSSRSTTRSIRKAKGTTSKMVVSATWCSCRSSSWLPLFVNMYVPTGSKNSGRKLQMECGLQKTMKMDVCFQRKKELGVRPVSCLDSTLVAWTRNPRGSSHGCNQKCLVCVLRNRCCSLWDWCQYFVRLSSLDETGNRQVAANLQQLLTTDNVHTVAFGLGSVPLHATFSTPLVSPSIRQRSFVQIELFAQISNC